MSATKGFIAPSLKNQILVNYLKPKVKAQENKNIKKDIQLLIRIGRSQTHHLEGKISELKILTQNVMMASKN